MHVRRTKLLEMGSDMFVTRVGSKENLSDDPSRERYTLLQRLGVCHYFVFRVAGA